MLSEDEMSPDMLKMEKIRQKWSEIRHMDKEQAAELDGEWKEAYDRYFEKYHSDMDSMEEIAQTLKKIIDPPKVQRKTKGQRKRDAFAKVQAREAARAGKI